MVSTCSFISKPSNPFTNPLEIFTSAPFTIGIHATFMFHGFLVLLLLLVIIIIIIIIRNNNNINHNDNNLRDKQITQSRLDDQT